MGSPVWKYPVSIDLLSLELGEWDATSNLFQAKCCKTGDVIMGCLFDQYVVLVRLKRQSHFSLGLVIDAFSIPQDHLHTFRDAMP